MGADTVHGTVVLIGGAGILIRGASGSGKTTLAFDLIETWHGRGAFACLVSDDRTSLDVRHGRLLARTPAPIAGLAELRGFGLLAVPHESMAVIRLIVDLVPPQAMVRLPEPATLAETLQGVTLMRQPVPERGGRGAVRLVEAALARLGPA